MNQASTEHKIRDRFPCFRTNKLSTSFVRSAIDEQDNSAKSLSTPNEGPSPSFLPSLFDASIVEQDTAASTMLRRQRDLRCLPLKPSLQSETRFYSIKYQVSTRPCGWPCERPSKGAWTRRCRDLSAAAEAAAAVKHNGDNEVRP